MRKKILIIDDDPAIIDSIQMLLEMEGYTVATMIDGDQIHTMKQPFPDLILLDIWMSGLDGRNIARFLKGKNETKHIPIIMVSASKDISKSAQESGVEDFLAKPFEMDELLAKVAKYVGNAV
ncbi:MAG: response regulator [Candidatus Levybacteria bacterium]|nr:response regulator [Candidatus Levybacteria bacterium]